LVNFYQTTRCYNPEDSNLQELYGLHKSPGIFSAMKTVDTCRTCGKKKILVNGHLEEREGDGQSNVKMDMGNNLCEWDVNGSGSGQCPMEVVGTGGVGTFWSCYR
jgi:hypothetical protein